MVNFLCSNNFNLYLTLIIVDPSFSGGFSGFVLRLLYLFCCCCSTVIGTFCCIIVSEDFGAWFFCKSVGTIFGVICCAITSVDLGGCYCAIIGCFWIPIT